MSKSSPRSRSTNSGAPAPLTRARAVSGGSRSRRRRALSTETSRPGSAASAETRTSWSKRRVRTTTRPLRRRPPTRRDARASNERACSPERKRGAKSSWSKSKKTTAEAEGTRCNTASVPISTGALEKASGPRAPSPTSATSSPVSAARSSRARDTPGLTMWGLVGPQLGQHAGLEDEHLGQLNSARSPAAGRRSWMRAPPQASHRSKLRHSPQASRRARPLRLSTATTGRAGSALAASRNTEASRVG